jgi:hypothetical protein
VFPNSLHEIDRIVLFGFVHTTALELTVGVQPVALPTVMSPGPGAVMCASLPQNNQQILVQRASPAGCVGGIVKVSLMICMVLVPLIQFTSSGVNPKYC